MTMRVRDILLGLVALAATSSLALAVAPPWAGGDRGGGGKPTAPDLYGDMVLIDRDQNGVPIMTDGLGPKDQLTKVPWPIMLGGKVDCELWPLGGEPLLERPEGEVGPVLVPVEAPSVYADLGIEAYRIPFVDYEIPAEYATYCTTEADFGRLSSSRSPDYVVDHSLLEMVTTLSEVDQAGEGEQIFLDPAGRLAVIYNTTDEYGLPIVVEKTIDAPLENLAGFERILERAELFHADVNNGEAIVMPPRPGGHTGAIHLLDRAAAMLGAAGDKSGKIGMDEVVYITLVRGVPTDMQTNEFGGSFKDENGVEYFNFSNFEYVRGETYNGVDICYLKVDSTGGGPETGYDVGGTLTREPLLPLVFDDGDGGFENFEGDNVWAFAQAADDTRAVIEFVHDHPVPIELADECAALMTD